MNGRGMANRPKGNKVMQLLTGWIPPPPPLLTLYLVCFHCFLPSDKVPQNPNTCI